MHSSNPNSSAQNSQNPTPNKKRFRVAVCGWNNFLGAALIDALAEKDINGRPVELIAIDARETCSVISDGSNTISSTDTQLSQTPLDTTLLSSQSTSFIDNHLLGQMESRNEDQIRVRHGWLQPRVNIFESLFSKSFSKISLWVYYDLKSESFEVDRLEDLDAFIDLTSFQNYLMTVYGGKSEDPIILSKGSKRGPFSFAADSTNVDNDIYGTVDKFRKSFTSRVSSMASDASKPKVLRDTDRIRFFAKKFLELERPPYALLAGSSLAIYGTRASCEILTETSDIGQGPECETLRHFELEALSASVNKVLLLRFGSIMSGYGGFIPNLFSISDSPFTYVFDDDNKLYKWIGLDDAVAAILHILIHLHSDEIKGPINICSDIQSTLADLNEQYRQHVTSSSWVQFNMAVPDTIMKTVFSGLVNESSGMDVNVKPTILNLTDFSYTLPSLHSSIQASLRQRHIYMTESNTLINHKNDLQSMLFKFGHTLTTGIESASEKIQDMASGTISNIKKASPFISSVWDMIEDHRYTLNSGDDPRHNLGQSVDDMSIVADVGDFEDRSVSTLSDNSILYDGKRPKVNSSSPSERADNPTIISDDPMHRMSQQGSSITSTSDKTESQGLGTDTET